MQPPASPRANINRERMAHLGLSCRFGRERVVLAPAVRVSEPPRPGGGARRVTQLPRGAVRRPGVDDLVHAIGLVTAARLTPTVASLRQTHVLCCIGRGSAGSRSPLSIAFTALPAFKRFLTNTALSTVIRRPDKPNIYCE